MEGCVVVFVIILVAAIVAAVGRNKERSQAHLAYQRALARLKSDPANPDLRGETLRLGRVYSNLMRDRRGVALFDEVALSNDINAACAGALRPQKQLIDRAAGLPVETRLAQLADLRAKGLIDESEYATRRLEILREI